MSSELILPPPDKRTLEWTEQFIQNYWLNLGDTSQIVTENPFAKRTPYEIENPHVFVLDMMRRPENFGFTCKLLFGKTLAPFQMAALRELWLRPFPMVIASRGAGKCIKGDSLVVTNEGICQIQDLAKNSPPMKPVFRDALQVLGENGFRDVAYSWSNGWGPTKKIHTNFGFELEGTPEHPIRVIRAGESEMRWVELQHLKVGDKAAIDLRPTWPSPAYSPLTEDEAFALGQRCADAASDVPCEVLQGNAEVVRAFVRGALDGRTHFASSSPSLVKTLQFILTRFGILSARVERFRHHLFIRDRVESNLYFDPIVSIEDGYAETYDVHVPDDHSFLSNGFVSHNTFLLALYAMLRGLFHQGSKIVIIGAAFRQAKAVFDYCQEIWDSSPVLRDLVGTDRRNGPRRDIDRCSLRMGDSIILAFPLGNGDKVRGQRASVTLSDEFACIDGLSLVETTDGLCRISDLVDEGRYCELFTGNNKHPVEVPDLFIRTKPIDRYEVITANGYSFICSERHKVMTTKGWKLGKDLTSDDFLLFENHYEFPTQYVERDGLVVDEEIAWLFGILTAEGCIVSKCNFVLKMTDAECVGRVRDALRKLSPDHKVGWYEHAAYQDDRGWDCKQSYQTYVSNLALRNKFASLGLDRDKSRTKKIPWSILQSPRSVVVAYLAGLFEGDGSAFLFKDKKTENCLGVTFYTGSEQLAREVQILLWKLDIDSSKQRRNGNISRNDQYMVRLNGRHAHNLCKLLQIKKWEPVIQAAHPPAKERTGVSYDKSRKKWFATTYANGRTKGLGRFDTKELALAEAAKNKPPRQLRVKSVTLLEGKDNLYDFYLPKTNSFFANGFRQHNSIPVEIFETVVRGFGAVSMAPVEKLQHFSRIDAMKEIGIWTPEQEAESNGVLGNQTVISGTCSYAFNHFYEYWARYKAIIESQGDVRKLAEVFNGEIPDSFNWKDYSIIRLPYKLLPKGFMDEKQIAQAKATINLGIFNMEYSAVFATDSNGFFRRSLIESCVVGKPKRPIVHACGEVRFNAVLKGSPNRRYIMAVDPASENDNFSIVILECWEDHRRIVYCWTTTRSRFKAKLKHGLAKEQDFYGYTARKIRDLRKVFNIDRIAVDAQGGGIAVMEALQDGARLMPGEQKILPVIDPEDPKDTDGMPGEHILEIIQFAKAEWVRDANHGLRKDMEDKTLLFPEFDPAILALSLEEDKEAGRIKVNQKDASIEKLYDTLEDCVMEIEDLKDELATIVHTQTGTAMRDRWDTPETKLAGGKKGRLRKDRYSSLLMANMVARQIHRAPVVIEYQAAGGFAREIGGAARDKNAQGGVLWIAQSPEGAWWAEQNNRAFVKGGYGVVVKR